MLGKECNPVKGEQIHVPFVTGPILSVCDSVLGTGPAYFRSRLARNVTPTRGEQIPVSELLLLLKTDCSVHIVTCSIQSDCLKAEVLTLTLYLWLQIGVTVT